MGTAVTPSSVEMGCKQSTPADAPQKANNGGSVKVEFSQSQNSVQLPTPRVVTPPPLPQPSPPIVDTSKPIYVARYTYTARTAEDLSFDKGDKLMILAGLEGDWWMARSMKSNREGYIPRNYVAPLASYEAEE